MTPGDSDPAEALQGLRLHLPGYTTMVGPVVEHPVVRTHPETGRKRPPQ